MSFASTSSNAADTVKVVPPQKTLSSQNEHFVFGQISDYCGDQYMLDTQTGKLWALSVKKSKNPDGTDAPSEVYRLLDPIPYSDINGKLSLGPK